MTEDTEPRTVAILCGGRGTRLQEKTVDIPKPLVEIGAEPIVWHVIQIYAAQGLRDFLLLTGYKGDLIERWAAEREWPEGVRVRCLDTGVDTPTGGRIRQACQALGDVPFHATYADGVADVDVQRLVAYHREHGTAATMTVVRPELQWGIALIDQDDRITGFHEKPRTDHWINGGFFVFEPQVLDYLSDSSVLEREPLEGLAEDRQLSAFRHTGFWECMDTYKDTQLLNDLWARERPPWKVW